jgi:phage replication-related protein YjqB (UPF0714/DUF867 family)
MPAQRVHQQAAEVSARGDRYASFAALAAAERAGIDYRIRSRAGRLPAVVMAPHGGGIEPGSSEIAEAVAGADYGFYAFEGLKPRGNRDLHVTSANFDEPRALALLAGAEYVVTVHGWGHAAPVTYVGGRDEALRDAIAQALEAAQFRAQRDGVPHLQGTDPRNICNRGRRGRGAQLEMSTALRHEITGPGSNRAGFATYVAAVRRAISHVIGA